LVDKQRVVIGVSHNFE